MRLLYKVVLKKMAGRILIKKEKTYANSSHVRLFLHCSNKENIKYVPTKQDAGRYIIQTKSARMYVEMDVHQYPNCC